MTKIEFTAKLSSIDGRTILRLPSSASTKLPSRGIVLIKGVINKTSLQVILEPDGVGGHWFEVEDKLLKAVSAKGGESVTLAIEPSKEWPEPIVPADLQAALKSHPEVRETWLDITPMARWDWIRWVRSTKNPETRKHRVEVLCSKLDSGKRRACCFNRTECTDPAVSDKGILIGASKTSSV